MPHARDVPSAVTLLLLAAGAPHASAIQWTNALGGAFVDGANWVGGSPPTSTGSAEFGLASTYSASFSANRNCGRILVTGGDVGLALSGFSYNLLVVSPSPSVLVEAPAPSLARLRINSGTVTCIAASVGSQAMTRGSVVLTGAAPVWTGSGLLSVGIAGEGTVDVESGGKLSFAGGVNIGTGAGSLGSATVTGPNGTEFFAGTILSPAALVVGLSGAGVYTATGNNSTRASTFSLAVNPGSTGDATFSGFANASLTGSAIVGGQGDGSLRVDSGSILTTTFAVIVAQSPTGVGDVEVSGAGARITAGSYASIGAAGNGTASVDMGGRLNSNNDFWIGEFAGADGAVAIRNTGSTLGVSRLLTVGVAGAGTLDISDGADATSGSSTIGDAAGSIGEVTVVDAGSTWSAAALTVADEGTGSLTIDQGGSVTVSSGATTIGAVAGSDGLVELRGVGSLLTISSASSSALSIAPAGSGELRLSAGADCSVSGGGIVGALGGVGTITADGAGTTLVCNAGFLGFYSAGSGLSLTGGATATSRGAHIDPGATAFMSGVGSLWKAITQPATIAGTLTLLTGGSLEAPSISISSTGAVRGFDAGMTGATTNAGEISPGIIAGNPLLDFGYLEVFGSFTQTASGRCTIQLNELGFGGPQNDLVAINGAATLAGALDVALVGSEPPVGKTYIIMNYASRTGAFTSVNLPTLSAGKYFQLIYDTFQVKLVVRAACPADLDGDGQVGSSDLAILLGSWGACASCPADLNGDGTVGAADLATLLGSWGACP